MKSGVNGKIAAILLMAVVLGAGLFLAIGQLGQITRLTVLSLQQADFRSTSEFFNEKTWILYTSQGGMAQSVEGRIDNEDVGAKSGTTPVNDLAIDLTYSTQSCEYPVKYDGQAVEIEYLNMYTWSCLWSPSDADVKQRCTKPVVYQGKFSGSYDCFCIERASSYSIGRFENPAVHTISTIEVSAKGESYSANIDTKSTINTKIGSNVYVRWDGYKTTALPCADQEPYRATYKDGSWKVISTSAYSNYVRQRSFFDNLLGSNPSKNYVTEQLSLLKTKTDAAVSSASFGIVNNPSSLVSAVLVKDVSSSFVGIPTYIFYVKAAWLGIVQPIGKPQIVSAQGVQARTGNDAIVNVVVKNIGDGRDTFTVSISCPTFASRGAISNTVYPNAEQLYQLNVYGDVSQPKTETCTVTARGVTESDSKTVSVTFDPRLVCQANAWTCEQNAVKKCNAYGSALDLITQCSPDMECAYRTNGEAYCKQISADCAQDGEKPVILIKPCCAGLIEENGVCKTKGMEMPWTLIFAALVGVMAFALMSIMLAGKGSMSYIVGGTFGLMCSLIAYFVLEFLLKTWWILLIGGLIGGGLIIWVFGLTAVVAAILMLLSFVRRK